jgi:RNA polymerase sigma-54 factor
MNNGMELRTRQGMSMTPQLHQAVRLLQMSTLEFDKELRQALDTNPFLEEPEPEEVSEPHEVLTGSGSIESTPSDEAPDPLPEDFDRAPGAEMFSGSPGGFDDDESDWTEWTKSQTTFRDHLREQLRLSPMGDRDRALAHLIVDALDNDGYLTSSLEELAELVLDEHAVAAEDLAPLLRLVQTLEPAGTGARTLQECLLLQLRALPPETPGLPVALELIGEHIVLLATREFLRLQQLLGCSEMDIHIARKLIRSLDPHPGRRFGPDETRYVVPDVIVSKARSKWVVTMNPAVLPRVRINQAYAEIASGRTHGAMSRQLQEARWLIRNMEQRFVTIQRVAESIVARQRNFLEYGDVAMKPLALQQVADELGVHESTVCRVTNGKYMATPRGLFEFKRFFSRELATEQGGTCSATAIRAVLRDLINKEDPGAPLSDPQLTLLLAGQGLRVARRTVTKYRKLMRLPSVELRRATAHQGFHLHASI